MNDAIHPITPLSRRMLWIGIAVCYGLAYAFILALAARKGVDLINAYSLLVWLVSAVAVSSFCGLISLVLAAAVGRLAVSLKTFLLLWGGLTVLIGSALVFNAR